MIYKIISLKELPDVMIKGEAVSKYEMRVEDEKGRQETVSSLDTPPAVGSVVDAEIRVVEKDGRVYKNFYIKRAKPKEGITELPKEEEKVQHVAPVVTQETETVTTVFPKKTRFLSNLEVREKFDFTKEEKIENGKEQNIRIARQGFMNQMSSLRTQFKDFKSWYAIVLELEPIYRLYIETGELPIEKKK